MADMAGAEKVAVLDGKGGQGESLPLDTLDNVIAFFWRSMDVLQLLNVVGVMPPAPFPDGYPAASDGAKKNWQRLHREIPANSVYREHNTTPRAILGRWFDAKGSAYKQANSDEMRADIVNLGSVLGERQNILVDFPNMAESERDASTLKTLAEITSEITGFTLAEFGRCLSALRRQIHVAAVRDNRENPKGTAALMDDKERAMYDALPDAKSTPRRLDILMRKTGVSKTTALKRLKALQDKGIAKHHGNGKIKRGGYTKTA